MAGSLHLAFGLHGVIGNNAVSLATEGVRHGLEFYYWVLMGEKPSRETKMFVLGNKWRRGLVICRLVMKVGVILLSYLIL